VALSINPATKVITIPQADLIFVSGTLYELDTNAFRLDVLALIASEPYIWMPDAYSHNTEVTVAGTTFARTLEFINGYSIEFENLTYSVRLAGSNNNIFDVENGILVQNLVQVIAQNSGGLIVGPDSGSLTAQETADAVWLPQTTDYPDPTTMGGKLFASLASLPTDTRDAVWTAATTLYSDDTKMGGKILADLTALLTALSSGVDLSPTQTVQLKEIWQVLGLDPSNVLTVSKTLRTAGTAVTQTIQEDVPVAGSVRVTKT
jgi:hypothetical protein